MNALARVFAALSGEPADRRAFSLVLSLYGAKLTGCPLDAYYAQPEKYLAGQQAVVKQFDPDILFAPFALTLEARAFGCQLIHFDTSPPNVRKPACRGLSDLASLLVPELSSDPGLRYLIESVRLLAAEFGKDKPIAAVLTAPGDLPTLLVSIGEWIEALLFHPAARDELVHKTSEHFVNLANAMLEAGASFVVTPVIFANPRLMPASLAKDIMIPILSEAFSRVRGPIVFHHGGNKLSGFLDLFAGLPNVVGYVLDQRDSFQQARSVLGPDPLLLGNLSGPHLPGYSPKQAYDRTQAIVRERADDPRYVFCTVNADVPWDTPMETIAAVRQAVLDSAGMSS